MSPSRKDEEGKQVAIWFSPEPYKRLVGTSSGGVAPRLPSARVSCAGRTRAPISVDTRMESLQAGAVPVAIRCPSSGDEEIGDVIADAIAKVGKDGVLKVEEGQMVA